MINSFTSEYRFLSNFWPAKVTLEGLVFDSVEHAYVAAKTTDAEIRKQVQQIKNTGEVKKFGRTIKLRSDWESVKLSIMEDLLRQKFSNSHLKQQLFLTGSHELVEGNWWGDIFWGVCNGVGENNLGKLLMKIRDEII